MIPIILFVLSLLLDGIFSNFLPYVQNTLSWWTPLFTVTSIFFLYPFDRKNKKKYYLTLLILGVIYDLMYTHLGFFHGVIFILLGWMIQMIYKNFEVTFIRLLLYIPILILVYELLGGGILYLFQVVPVTWHKVLYKGTHSILINVIYAEIIYGILHKIPKKYKRVKMNE